MGTENIDRRAFLTGSAAAAVALFTATIDSRLTAVAKETQALLAEGNNPVWGYPENESLPGYMRLPYWPDRPDLPTQSLPSPEQVHEAVKSCREAGVMVEFHGDDTTKLGSDMKGFQAGFILDLGEAGLTAEGRKWKFVVTCHHGFSRTKANKICVVFSDKSSTKPMNSSETLIVPGADLVLCKVPNTLNNLSGLKPIENFKIVKDRPAMFYGPKLLDFSGSTYDSEKKETVRWYGEQERELIALVTMEEGQSTSQGYPDQKMLVTSGGLFRRFSGSPGILWEGSEHYVGSVQTERERDSNATYALYNGQEISDADSVLLDVLFTFLRSRGYLQ